jgi:hypothetical protein
VVRARRRIDRLSLLCHALAHSPFSRGELKAGTGSVLPFGFGRVAIHLEVYAPRLQSDEPPTWGGEDRSVILANCLAMKATVLPIEQQ